MPYLIRLFVLVFCCLSIPAGAVSLQDVLGQSPSRPGDFLDVDEAFKPALEVVGDKVYVRFRIAPGYYLYQHRFQFQAKGAELGQPAFPAGAAHDDEYFGKVTVYREAVEIPVPLRQAHGDFTVDVSYQGCADKGLCYPPTDKHFDLNAELDTGSSALTGTTNTKAAATGAKALPEADVPSEPGPVSEENRLARLLSGASLGKVIGIFLLAGLALAFTPCVFPMLPIVASLVAGQAGRGVSPWRGFLLSLAYVQGMALSFAGLGVAAAVAGRGLAGSFQSPWLVGTVAVLFVLLALSMFGLYELQLPSRLTSRASELSNRQRSGTYLGAALMGVLGTLVVSPCVTPPLTAAILYVAQSGDKLLGAVALYTLALGMGLPLLVVGAAGGRLLPRAGGWMNGVKAGFGVAMLGLALYLIARFLPGPLVLLLWGTLLIVSAVYLGAFSRDRESKWTPLRQGLGLVLFVIGIAQALGAAMGHDDPLAPLAGLGLGSNAQAAATSEAGFRPFKTDEQLQTLIADAARQGKPVMVDFYADWCVACREFAAKTFPDPTVRRWLDQAVVLQADVTANDADDIRLLKVRQILGLPTLLFFDRQGREIPDSRVTGFMSAERFSAHLERIWR